MCGDKTCRNCKGIKRRNAKGLLLAQGIEKQVIRETVCSKVSWDLDRDSPFFKVGDCGDRARDLCGEEIGKPFLGAGRRVKDEVRVLSRILCGLLSKPKSVVPKPIQVVDLL